MDDEFFLDIIWITLAAASSKSNHEQMRVGFFAFANQYNVIYPHTHAAFLVYEPVFLSFTLKVYVAADNLLSHSSIIIGLLILMLHK